MVYDKPIYNVFVNISDNPDDYHVFLMGLY